MAPAGHPLQRICTDCGDQGVDNEEGGLAQWQDLLRMGTLDAGMLAA
jgi:hypothetical protein